MVHGGAPMNAALPGLGGSIPAALEAALLLLPAVSRVLGFHTWQDRNFLTCWVPMERLEPHIRRLAQAGHKVRLHARLVVRTCCAAQRGLQHRGDPPWGRPGCRAQPRLGACPECTLPRPMPARQVGVVRQVESAAIKKAGDNKAGPFERRLTALHTRATLEVSWAGAGK